MCHITVQVIICSVCRGKIEERKTDMICKRAQESAGGFLDCGRDEGEWAIPAAYGTGHQCGQEQPT